MALWTNRVTHHSNWLVKKVIIHKITDNAKLNGRETIEFLRILFQAKISLKIGRM